MKSLVGCWGIQKVTICGQQHANMNITCGQSGSTEDQYLRATTCYHEHNLWVDRIYSYLAIDCGKLLLPQIVLMGS